MIIVYHINRHIVGVRRDTGEDLPFDKKLNFGRMLENLAVSHPDESIAWCYEPFAPMLSFQELHRNGKHTNRMVSYRPGAENYFPPQIGYCDESLFINIRKSVTFPTWQMSGAAGVTHASVIRLSIDFVAGHNNPDLYLSSLAKQNMPMGLLCYSEPALLDNARTYRYTARSSQLFAFVKQHYKTRWLFLLFLNTLIYERRILLGPLFKALFVRALRKPVSDFSCKIKNIPSSTDTIDVIIPTIGRKKYLKDFLLDLSAQTYLPTHVIIVEQNPDEGSLSELDYLEQCPWPFRIIHTFTNQAGACNARNMALEAVTSKWLFFADDDIRIDVDFIESAISKLKSTESRAASFECLQQGQSTTFNHIFQWYSFGSGCSIVSREAVGSRRFAMEYEFGFGEDADFGMQLRIAGTDILYIPEPKILHIKAPVGGFRTKPPLLWANDLIKPKPSPTVMLYLLTYYTRQQLNGYRTTLFLKYYSKQPIKNPVAYFKTFRKAWMASHRWAHVLLKRKIRKDCLD